MTQRATLRNVTIGNCANGDQYILTLPGISGLGIPDVKAADQDRLGGHGVVGGYDRLNTRTITIPVMIHERDDPQTAMTRLRALKTAWRPADQDSVLSLEIPGYGPSDGTIRFWGRPRAAIDANLGRLHTGTIEALLSFIATDPIGYGQETTVSLSAGSNTIMVSGDAPSYRGVITLTGNGGTPEITSVTDASRKIQFRTPLGSGVVVSIDLFAKTAIRDNGDDMFSSIAPNSNWFHLAGGSNTLTLSGASSGQMTFRGGWW